MKIIDLGWPWRSLTISTVGCPSDSLASCNTTLMRDGQTSDDSKYTIMCMELGLHSRRLKRLATSWIVTIWVAPVWVRYRPWAGKLSQLGWVISDPWPTPDCMYCCTVTFLWAHVVVETLNETDRVISRNPTTSISCRFVGQQIRLRIKASGVWSLGYKYR